MNDLTLRSLRETDEIVVKTWLRPYLREHLGWWEAAYGVAARVPLEDLVRREWNDLLGASRAADSFVSLAERPGEAAPEPLGAVLAACRDDRYLGIKLGVLGWLYVAEAARGQGVSSRLLGAADTWMSTQQVEGREVFVTSENRAAVAAYRRFGYRAVDTRMLGPAPQVAAAIKSPL